MQNSDVIKLLKALTEAEIKALKKYLKCTYFNKNRNCEKLFTILIKYYPDFTNPKVAKEKIYYRIFSKATNYQKNDNNLRTLMSALKKQIKQFLILQELNQPTNQAQLLLLNALTKRDVSNDLIKAVKKEILQSDQKMSSQYFLDRFQLYLKLYEKEATNHFNPDNESFTDLNNNLDVFFTLTKLKLGIEHQSLIKRKINIVPIEFLTAAQTYVAHNKSTVPIILQLYVDVFALSETPSLNISKFQQTFSLFQQNLSHLEKKEIEEIVAILYNFTNQKVKQAILAPIYKRQRFEVVKLGLTQGTYLQKNVIPNSPFMMIALSAASAAQFDWAENFLQENSALLPIESRELDEAYIKGIYFGLKASQTKAAPDFEQCLTAFNNLKDKNPKYNKAKIWNLLKCYYEYFIHCGSNKIRSYSENYHILVKRSTCFEEHEKRSLLDTVNALKFLIKSRHYPNLPLKKVIPRITKIQSKSHYKELWLTTMIGEFLRFKFPTISFILKDGKYF